MPKDGRGWHRDSARHALAAKGVKTGRKASQQRHADLIRSTASDILASALNVLDSYSAKSPSSTGIRGAIDKIRNQKDALPMDSPERRALEELEWILVQFNDDPDRLLREKWGFDPRGD